MKNLILSIILIFAFKQTFPQNPNQVNAPCFTANVLVLMDKSISMKNTEFPICYLTQSILGNLPIGLNKAWFGVGTFGDTCKVVPLSGISDGLHETVMEMCQHQANQKYTNLNDELIFVNSFFERANFERGRINPNILIIISDGKFSLPDKTEANTKMLKYNGVEIFTIGLDIESDGEEQMIKISSNENYYYADDIDGAIEVILRKMGCL